MKFTIASRFVLGALAMLVLSIAGCSGSSFKTVPVSGTVTLDGEPLAGVKVVFFPEPPESTAELAPFSSATTDAEGKFTLQTRYNEPGAVVGAHRVSFAYADIDEDAVEDAEETASEAKAAQNQLEERKRIPKKYGNDGEIRIEVPAGGMDNADFQLKSK